MSENQFNQNDALLATLEAPEVDFDALQAAELLSNICAKFPDAKLVRETYEPVQELILLTGMNSWEEFCKDKANLINEYWQAETAKPETPVENKRLALAERQYSAIKTKVVAAEKQLAYVKDCIQSLTAKIEDAKCCINEESLLTWDPEAKKRAEEARNFLKHGERKLAELKKQGNDLQNTLPGLYSTERRIKGRIIAASKAQAMFAAGKSNAMIHINTGSAKEDAWLINRLADSIAFKVVTLEAQIHKQQLKVESQRFEDPLANMSELNDPFVTNGMGGVYDTQLETLKAIQDEMDNYHAILASCEWEYEAIAAFGNTDPTKWFPEWIPWENRLNKSRTSLYNGAMRRSQADRAAFAALKQR